MSRKPRHLALLPVLAGTVICCLLPAGTSSAARISLEPERSERGTLLYRLAGLAAVPAADIRGGYLRSGGRRCALPAGRVRGAARRGILRVKASRRQGRSLWRCRTRHGRPVLVVVTAAHPAPIVTPLLEVVPDSRGLEASPGPAGPQRELRELPGGDPPPPPADEPPPPQPGDRLPGPSADDQLDLAANEPPVAGQVAYYVNPEAGNDAGSGRSEGEAWRTLERASQAPLGPGDLLLLKRGSDFSGTLDLAQSGTQESPITVSGYGAGALPRLQGGCVVLTGSHVTVKRLHVDSCGWTGIDVHGDNNRIERTRVTNNIAGVLVRRGALRNFVVWNQIRDNDRMSVLTSGGQDDSGAFGVLLQGERTQVAYNTITGSDAFSYDYGRDGAATEVFGGQYSHVHHNLALDNHVFTELGDSGSVGNTFSYNVVRSSLEHSTFVITRGAESGYGPIRGTHLYNNTVRLTGALSEGVICHGGCGPEILKMENNVVEAVLKAGFADAAFDESRNLYFGGQLQLDLGPGSLYADPRFADAPSGDLRLRSTSPAVDRGGFVFYNHDFAGQPSPRDGDGDGGSEIDLGAFEFQP